MFLRRIQIENFRAIRKCAISFNDGTALIGENDCGISSVLQALELALSPWADRTRFPNYLFHHARGGQRVSGPIRIQLRFIENRKNEWSGSEFTAFTPLLPERSDRRRELWYEIVIRQDNDEPAHAVFSLRSPGRKGKTSDPALLDRIRQMNPVVRVSAGMLTGHGSGNGRLTGDSVAEQSFSPEITSLVGRINSAVESRLRGRSLDLNADLDDGFTAAFELVSLGEFKLGVQESGLSRSVGEILGWSKARKQAPRRTEWREPDGAAERLGILLLIGALLRARPAGLLPEADPLWILEEPEAHLHPITLTSVARFVSLIQRQKIITTYSGDLLASIPLRQVRRLIRHEGNLLERRVRDNKLSLNELRRIQYHLRSRFSGASFARLWLLVEGESEFWFLPQLARQMGYEFALEGIACVEFAQCGLDPLIKVAKEWGIEWHLLSDGDSAGQSYAETARGFLGEDDPLERVTVLAEPDIEQCFWQHGYASVYERLSRVPTGKLARLKPDQVIQAAVRKQSKPYLALRVVEAVAQAESPGIPGALTDMIEACVAMARSSPGRLIGS